MTPARVAAASKLLPTCTGPPLIECDESLLWLCDIRHQPTNLCAFRISYVPSFARARAIARIWSLMGDCDHRAPSVAVVLLSE